MHVISTTTTQLATLVPHHWIPQASLETGKKELDKQKAASRERDKELQRFEQERKEKEKDMVDYNIKIKELEHKIAKFHKDSRDAAHRVRRTRAYKARIYVPL